MGDFKDTGMASLHNGKTYPFNDSEQIVALSKDAPDTNYFVLTEITDADGEVGDIVVSGKALNGFRIAFTGSAREVKIRYCVI